MVELSAFPSDSKVPARLRGLLTARAPKPVRVKMSEAGDPKDPRRNQLADFCEVHDLQVHFDPFRDIWTISRKPEPTLFSEATHG